MNLASDIRTRGSALINGWRNFWFQPQAAYTLGVVRIAFGALVVCWTVLLGSDLYTAFGTKGVMPKAPSREFAWGVFNTYSSDNALFVGWCVLLGAAVALMVGWHSRLAAILVFILILSFERRNPLLFNSGDTVIRIEAIFLALAPCGAALSLDQRRRTGSFFSAQEIRPWALRLLQVQLSIIYLSTVVAKLAGQTWQNGTAVAYSLRQRDLLILTPPEWVLNNLMIANALTWGTLVIEVAIGVLVWKQNWRPWVLAMGVVLHLSISLFLEVGFFSASMFVLYLAFVPPERVKALIAQCEKRLSALTARRHDDEGDEDEDDLPVPEEGERVVVDGDTVDEPVSAPRLGVVANGRVVREFVPPQQMRPDVATSGAVPAAVNGHRVREPLPGPRRLPVRRPITEVQPTGRHARRPNGTNGSRDFH